MALVQLPLSVGICDTNIVQKLRLFGVGKCWLLQHRGFSGRLEQLLKLFVQIYFFSCIRNVPHNWKAWVTLVASDMPGQNGLSKSLL